MYCGKRDVPLEVEQVVPKSRGGSNRVISCINCNRDKDSQTTEEFGYPEIQEQAKESLKDTSVVNSIGWDMYNRLKNSIFLLK